MDVAAGAQSRLERNIKLRIGEQATRLPRVARLSSFFELRASIIVVWQSAVVLSWAAGSVSPSCDRVRTPVKLVIMIAAMSLRSPSGIRGRSGVR